MPHGSDTEPFYHDMTKNEIDPTFTIPQHVCIPRSLNYTDYVQFGAHKHF